MLWVAKGNCTLTNVNQKNRRFMGRREGETKVGTGTSKHTEHVADMLIMGIRERSPDCRDCRNGSRHFGSDRVHLALERPR